MHSKWTGMEIKGQWLLHGTFRSFNYYLCVVTAQQLKTHSFTLIYSPHSFLLVFYISPSRCWSFNSNGIFKDIQRGGDKRDWKTDCSERQSRYNMNVSRQLAQQTCPVDKWSNERVSGRVSQTQWVSVGKWDGHERTIRRALDCAAFTESVHWVREFRYVRTVNKYSGFLGAMLLTAIILYSCTWKLQKISGPKRESGNIHERKVGSRFSVKAKPHSLSSIT